jgi:hypothetical protein
MTTGSLAEQAARIERAIQIAARASQATPGPWGYLRPSGVICGPDGSDVADCLHDPDVLFIAHAPEDTVWLLQQLLVDLAALVALQGRIALLHAGIRRANAALDRLPWQGDGLRHLVAEGAATAEVVAAIHVVAGALDPEDLGLKDGGS